MSELGKLKVISQSRVVNSAAHEVAQLRIDNVVVVIIFSNMPVILREAV